MANLLVWPSKYFFYAIGNTSAVSLTMDLSIDEPAQILLLGCGDPRNVLYTIFTEPLQSRRSLDFTCCDFDPAVLARNVLLFTMIADDIPSTTMWNIFFHFRLDKDSHNALIAQCTKLIELSSNPQKWRSSPYASSLHMCTDYTLSEIRRHWALYVSTKDLPASRLKAISGEFDKQARDSEKKGSSSTAFRSLGPLGFSAGHVLTEQFRNYWRTGVTSTDQKTILVSTILNPTFIYSLGGEGFSLHYGSDPLNLFHLAPVFGNTRKPVTVPEIVKAAKLQFEEWCGAYRKSPSNGGGPPIIRFFVGEATAVCRALRVFSGGSSTLNLGVPVAQWKTTLIKLNENEYTRSPGSSPAPSRFNVIHTSNLEDHIGLLNVLISSAPLLAPGPASVLYSESLLFLGHNATKEFTEHLHADLTVMGILIGLCPIDYLCGFTSRSNTHELAMNAAMKKDKSSIGQFQQIVTWRAPTSGDCLLASALLGHRSNPIIFDPHQLGTLLYDIYQSLFEKETSFNFWEAARAHGRHGFAKALGTSNMAHYTRESFVLLLSLIKSTIAPTEDVWTSVMDRFNSLQLAAWSPQSMDTLHYQDLCGQFLRHSLYTATFFHMKSPKIGPFTGWEGPVPDLIRIILIVPRSKLAVLTESKAEEIGTPPLHCDIFGRACHNIFTAVHVAFGRAIPMGTRARPQVVFEEDVEGWKGKSPLVVSFTASALLLTTLEPPQQLSVGFCVRNTPLACATLISKLGIQLRIFSANLMDKEHVHVLPEPPLPARYSPQRPSESPTALRPLSRQIGDNAPPAVELDEQCELVSSLTTRISITDPASVEHFSSSGSKVVPDVAQLSPCVMRVTLGDDRSQDVAYPFPVIGSSHRLRLARKSKYIELIVQASRSFMPDGMKLNPYPVLNINGNLHPWSIHRVNLSTLPIIEIKNPKLKNWLNPHVGSMMSSRERSLRKKHRRDALMYMKDTLHSIFVRTSGIQGGSVSRLFSLRDESTNNCDTIFFISDLRYDLAMHTVVCDGYVLPLTVALMERIAKPFSKLLQQGDMVHTTVFDGEMEGWKQLLPALVERCRSPSSWTHTANCEYRARKQILLTEDMEADPLCSCGRGKDVEGMLKVPLWKEFAPYVTRVALSPLFAVSYLETVGRDPAAHKCSVCRGRGKPKLKACSGCNKVRYCSETCQKKDWKAHKPKCKA